MEDRTNNPKRKLRLRTGSIKSKVFIACLSLVIIVASTSFFAYLQIDKLKESALRENFRTIQKLASDIKASSTEFVLRERNNENYFSTEQSTYLDQYDGALVAFRDIHQRTIDLLVMEGYDNNAELDQLTLLVNEHEKVFRGVESQIKERGLGTYGVIGRFKSSLDRISKFDYGVDNASLLRLQFYVKDYQLNGNIVTVKDVQNETYRFSTVLEKYITDSEVNDVIGALSAYESNFQKLVAIDTILGIYSDSGLQKRLFDIADEIDEKVKLAETSEKISSTYNSALQSALKNLGVTFVATVVLAFTMLIVMQKGIIKPINDLKEVVKKMGNGIIPEEVPTYKSEELEEMSLSVGRLAQGLENTSEFARNVGQGNFHYEFQPLGDQDVLGHALLKMRQNLEEAAEEERKRSWSTEGLAKFADILRSNKENIEELSQNIISNLVKYVKANQGALFVVNDDSETPYLEMKSCYAWDRKKHVEKKIEKGQGLLGQCWIEESSIYLTDVPRDFVVITSGLGDATPKCIFIVPLIVNEEVYGVLEIASLEDISEDERLFIEKLAESIASAIGSERINEQTRLLLEESQESTAQMRSQEEEMKQNMEELTATQEEMARKEKEYQDTISQLKQRLGMSSEEPVISKPA